MTVYKFFVTILRIRSAAGKLSLSIAAVVKATCSKKYTKLTILR